jgi:hypothetical protein
MNRTRRIGLAFILLSSGISILWGLSIVQPANGLVDFKAIYYGARCLIQHSDPYNEGEFLRVYREEGGQFPSDPTMAQLFNRAVPVCINLPSSLFLIVPFAILPWGPAHLLWMTLVACSLTLTAILTWNLAGDSANGVSLLLICLIVSNSEMLFASGNLAGIAVSLCIVSVWCFLKNRFVTTGIFCLAISLAIKPHDAGLVWLYFLLVGGIHRRRALQTLTLTVGLCLLAALWVTHVAPQWMPELHSNLLATSAHGDLSDPGPTSLSIHGPVRIIDLQTVISLFRDDPSIYNPISYLICGALLLAWAVRTLQTRFSRDRACIALAAIAALSMLPIYHRLYDAKLLLLAVPACALLWAEGGLTRWTALVVSTAGVVLTGDIPSTALIIFSNNLHLGAEGIIRQVLVVVLMRPTPLILLAMSIYYLCVYMRRTVNDTDIFTGQTIPAGSRSMPFTEEEK